MGLTFQPRWLISIPYGICKCCQIPLGIIILICTGVVDYTYNGTGFIQFAATGSLVTAIIFCAFYLVNIPDTVKFIPWPLVETAICGFWFMCYFIAMAVSAALSNKARAVVGNMHNCYSASAVFCVIGMIACGLESFGNMRKWMVSRALKQQQDAANIPKDPPPYRP